MRASRGDQRRKADAKIAAETSTDGLDEASAEEVERLIAEFGLVYERKVRAKEEMVELPAEPLAAGILPDDLTEMVDAAEPRKPTQDMPIVECVIVGMMNEKSSYLPPVCNCKFVTIE